MRLGAPAAVVSQVLPHPPILLREVSPSVLGAGRTAPGAAELLRGWMRMEPGRGAGRPPGEARVEGRGGAGAQKLWVGHLERSARGRIQKPNGRLVRTPGSAFVRARPPCAEGAGGSARGRQPAAPRVGPGGGEGRARCVGRARAALGAAGGGAGRARGWGRRPPG